MKGGMNKENAKKMLKGQSLKEVEHDSEPHIRETGKRNT
jgi:hypothetical protein